MTCVLEENEVILSKNSDVNAISVKAIEGAAVYGGELLVKPMLMGDEMTIMEIQYTPGVGAPLHSHTHESLVYVVRGKVKTTVGDDVHILGPGDVCRHPAGVPHGVEALEESVTIEIKSPAPDIANFFKT
jgi:unsaturated pyranuronate lyase